VRIVVFPNSLGIGGSQLNAVELAERMEQRGHHVVVFGPTGPLSDRIVAAGLAFEPAPARPRVRPSPAVMRTLVDVVRRHRADLVHGYEWPPVLEARFGPGLRHGTAVVGTIMSMGVAPFIPRDVPLAVGTEHIAVSERRRRPVVHVMEPPVDVERNRPGLELPDVRAEAGATASDLLVVVVSRLAHELKREGILDAVRAVGRLSAERPVRLAVVGDGPARDEIAAAAATVNDSRHRQVVTMVGSVPDPRPWYATADIVLGMGSSALRAMAFAKPLLVQGERGFWEPLTPETAATFLYQGWYGVGAGDDGSLRVQRLLEELADDAERRLTLGRFARDLVVERFSLESAADRQEQIYRDALTRQASEGSQARALIRPTAQVAQYEIRRRVLRLAGRATADDFNALSAQPGGAAPRSSS
jgi:glycosyltransferase involved in cell wall biosynthesis